MGGRRWGIGAGTAVQAAPASPESGSGGPGVIAGATRAFAPAAAEIGDVTTGRITLGVVNFTILALVGFYIWTRSAQGG